MVVRKRVNPRYLFGIGIGLLLQACSAQAPSQPNIVLITIDTLRADRLGAYGYAGARTPHLDALAARGRRFDQATTPLPRTTPALASLLTGLEPRSHGSREVGYRIRSGTLLSERFARHGYATVGLTCNGAAGTKQGFARGFDHFVDAYARGVEHAEGATELALAQVERVPDDAPLFLWVHYQDPHSPYWPAEPWRAGRDTQACRLLNLWAWDDPARWGQVYANYDDKARRAWKSCSDLYDADIANTDHYVGELFAGLKSRGRMENTWLILTADHGENLGEEGLFYQHGPSLHDASLRIPLIIAGPDVASGVDPDPITLVDLAPTILGLAALDAEEELEGIDQSRRVRGEAAGDSTRIAFSESGNALMIRNHPYLHSGWDGERSCLNGTRFSLCGEPGKVAGLFEPGVDPELGNDVSEDFPNALAVLRGARERWPVGHVRSRSARTPRFKLVDTPRIEGGYERKLVDLRADRDEAADVRDRHPDVVRRLGEALDSWTAKRAEAASPPVDPGVLEGLRALGYIE